MSTSDVDRFATDLKNDPDLLSEVKQHAGTLAKVVSFAEEHGYSFTLEEAKEYLEGKAGTELDDTQLDVVAGGKGPSHSPSPSSGPTQTTNVVVGPATVTDPGAFAAVVTAVAGVVVVT